MKANIVIRPPRMSDTQGLMEYINELVDENARILVTTKKTLVEEKKWVKGVIEGIKKKDMIFLCAEANGRIVGAANLRRFHSPPSSDAHTSELGFSVLSPWRRQGIAESLVKEILHRGKNMGMEIVISSYAADNRASAEFHKKLGFQTVGTIPRGYKNENTYVNVNIVWKNL